VVFGEMKIKEGLVYNKNEGRIVGFVDLGEVNNTLASFEQSLAQLTNHAHLPIAKHMLVFMVRGLFTSLKFPYAQEDLIADSLFPGMWSAIWKLQVSKSSCSLLTKGHATLNSSTFTSKVRVLRFLT